MRMVKILMFYTKNRFTCDVIKKEPNPDETEQDYDSEDEEKEDYEHIKHNEGDVSDHIYEHVLQLNNLINQIS